MRATRGILRAVIVAVIATGLISVTGSCRKQGPLERLGGKADDAMEKAGEAVEDAADKVKEGVEDAADKVKEATPNGSEEAKPKAE
jgi:uncharacterized protein YjbJ (UPF0337 family)